MKKRKRDFAEEELNEYSFNLLSLDDRSCAIVATALVEFPLAKAIENNLPNAKKLAELCAAITGLIIFIQYRCCIPPLKTCDLGLFFRKSKNLLNNQQGGYQWYSWGIYSFFFLAEA